MATEINLPRGPFIDLQTGMITREWYLWLLNPSFVSVNLSGAVGVLPSTAMPALSGDISNPSGSTVTTLATVNGAPGSYGSATKVATYTVNAKGLITLSGEVAISVSAGSVTGLGTMATQNANLVTITGGGLDNVAVGNTTPGPVSATVLKSTAQFGCNGATARPSATVNAAIASTAGATYTGTEQTMLNDIKALLNQIRTALVNNGIAV